MQKWVHMNAKEWCKRIFIVPSLDTLSWYAQIFGFWCLMHLKKILCCSLVLWWILSPHPASFTPVVSLFNHRSILTFRRGKFANNTIRLNRRKPGNVYEWRHVIYSFIQTPKGRRKILNKIRRCVTDGCVFGAVLRFGGGFSFLFFFLHFPPQTFYRIKPTTPPGDNNSFWHPRTTSTPAVSADQTPTRLQYATTTTTTTTGSLALHPVHLQLWLCLANRVQHVL